MGPECASSGTAGGGTGVRLHLGSSWHTGEGKGHDEDHPPSSGWVHYVEECTKNASDVTSPDEKVQIKRSVTVVTEVTEVNLVT